MPRGEDVARSRTGRAACSSTSHTPLQHGQRSNQGFLSSQREVQAAANFIDLIFLAFISRTPSNKLLVTFYPKVWGFFSLLFLRQIKNPDFGRVEHDLHFTYLFQLLCRSATNL